MSYSFNFQLASKEAAKTEASARFKAVIERSPEHAADLQAAELACHAFVDALHLNDGEGVTVSCDGSISWQKDDGGRLVVRRIGQACSVGAVALASG